MDRVEMAARWRRQALCVFVIGFIAWRLPEIDSFQSAVSLSTPITITLQIFGAIIWIGALITLILRPRKERREMSKSELSALEDERVQAMNDRAFRVGYWVMIIAAALLSVAGVFGWQISQDSADIILILGISVTLLNFVIRDAADG